MLSLHAGRLPSAAPLVSPDGYRCYESTPRKEFRSRGKQWLQWQEAPVIWEMVQMFQRFNAKA